MLNTLRITTLQLLLFSIVLGGLYPGLVTLAAQWLFPFEANGSVVHDAHGQPTHSALIGQPFDKPEYFWSRPSATQPVPYNAAASGGSNLGPTHPALVDAVTARIAALHAADPNPAKPIPIDLVTASASGLDPHISPAAADFQVARIAAARHLERERIAALVREHTEPRAWGVFGEPRVNVVALNRALDALR